MTWINNNVNSIRPLFINKKTKAIVVVYGQGFISMNDTGKPAKFFRYCKWRKPRNGTNWRTINIIKMINLDVRHIIGQGELFCMSDDEFFDKFRDVFTMEKIDFCTQTFNKLGAYARKS